jgi:hypothetical protein
LPPVPSPAVAGRAPSAKSAAGTRWARRPALAVCAAIALALAVPGLIGFLATSTGIRQLPDGSYYDPPLLGLFSVLLFFGVLISLVAVIWASIRALMLKRWGWAAGLLLGTPLVSLLTLLAASPLLALIFAVWGPTQPPGPKLAPTSAAQASPPPVTQSAG